jgi:hypothetical protein
MAARRAFNHGRERWRGLPKAAMAAAIETLTSPATTW